MIAPAVHRSTETMVTKLFPGDGLGKLVTGVTDAIFKSFRSVGAMAEQTMDEKRRRFKICMDWALVLRGDMKWGVQRIADAMPEILRTELSGTKWTPSKRQCWIPEDGR